MAEWFDSLTNIISLLFGGSVISIFTWKIARRKQLAEAKQAEQDYYQQVIEDITRDRDIWKKAYEEMRNKVLEYDHRIAELDSKVSNNTRQMATLRMLTCDDIHCKKRRCIVGEIQERMATATPQQPNDIEPNNDL